MRILNLGSINLDKSYRVAQFTQAGKTSKALGFSVSFGGKGLNQSVAMARAGCEVWHAGAVGEDGAEILTFMQEQGIHTEWVAHSDEPTGHAIIQLDPAGQNCILICAGANGTVAQAYIDRVLAFFSAGDLLVLQNETPCVSYAIEQAHKHGMLVVLNPSPIESAADIPAQWQSDFLILNEIEAGILTGVQGSKEQMAALRGKMPNAGIVLTLGEKGVLYAGAASNNAATLHCPARKTAVVDTTAAGDTFEGYFIASLAKGLPAATALEVATAASSLCIAKRGAARTIPCWEEVCAVVEHPTAENSEE